MYASDEIWPISTNTAPPLLVHRLVTWWWPSTPLSTSYQIRREDCVPAIGPFQGSSSDFQRSFWQPSLPQCNFDDFLLFMRENLRPCLHHAKFKKFQISLNHMPKHSMQEKETSSNSGRLMPYDWRKPRAPVNTRSRLNRQSALAHRDKPPTSTFSTQPVGIG